mmetsp:Transcript_73771/g.171089  ORF Transcript_73771/g.171089 Transcript_73771/m.171089 type:complete len:122 (+) Transcript_73771:1-366(+)
MTWSDDCTTAFIHHSAGGTTVKPPGLAAGGPSAKSPQLTTQERLRACDLAANNACAGGCPRAYAHAGIDAVTDFTVGVFDVDASGFSRRGGTGSSGGRPTEPSDDVPPLRILVALGLMGTL